MVKISIHINLSSHPHLKASTAATLYLQNYCRKEWRAQQIPGDAEGFIKVGSILAEGDGA